MAEELLRHYTTAEIPRGSYEGVWKGYEVRFEANGRNYAFSVAERHRGRQLDVIVKMTQTGFVVFKAEDNS